MGSGTAVLVEERSREQSSACPGLPPRPSHGHAGSTSGAGSRTAGALALVTNRKMTQMKADLRSAGGRVPVTVLALNMLLISTLLWVGTADS